MKSFQAVILAAILAAASADNEPVASPTFFKQELAQYEHQLRNLQNGSFSVPISAKAAKPPPLLGTDDLVGTNDFTMQPKTLQPTYQSYSTSMSYSYSGKGGKSGGGKGGKSGSKGGKSDSYSYSTSSMSYGSGKGGKSGGGNGKGGKTGSKRE